MKKEYIKNYLGIVVQNNDPLKRGRVKVWVPHVEMTVYEGWNNTQENRQFNFPGANNFSGLDANIIEQLRMSLPWAEVAMPMVGSGGSSGIYNSILDRGTISDKSEYLSEGLDFIDQKKKDELERAKKEIGEWKPIDKNRLDLLAREDGLPKTKGKKFPEMEDDVFVLGTKPAKLYQEKPVVDAFATSGEAQLNRYTNPYSNLYRPMPYSNSCMGSFSIPNVGAHVWVFFENGDPLKPVIFAASYGKEDWKSIYDSHENDKSSLGAAPDYPGKFENGTNRNDKEYQASRDDMIYRSKYSLVQRGGAITIVNTTEREILNLTHFSGSYKEFNNYTNTEFAANNDQRLVMNDAFYTVNGHRSEYVGGDYDIIIKGAYRVTFGDPKNHKEPLSQIKRLMEDFHKKYNLPFEIQRSILDDYGGQSGEFTSCPTCTKAIYASLENVADQVTQSIYSPSCPSETNLMPSPKAYSLVSVPTLECMTCGGTGKSPSTQDGSWGQNPNKASMTEALIDLQNRMFQYEEQLGNTEDNIMNYGKNQHIVVGSEMHDFQSYRIDPVGKMAPAGVKLSSTTAYQKMAATPLVEKVHVDAPPTGSFSMVCGFRYNLLVGSGGISLKTTGPVDISGSVTTIAGKQVVVSSENEVYVDGGKRLQLTADNISLAPKGGNGAQVYVGGNLEIDKNTIVRGGAHIEGELSVQHITAPIEYQSTETEVMAAHIVDDVVIGYIPNGTVLGIDSLGGLVTAFGDIPILGKSEPIPQVYTRPHYHLFKNIPLQLVETSTSVRQQAMALNGSSPVLAKPSVFSSDMAKKFENVDLSVLVSNDPIQSTSNSDVTLDSLLSIGEIIAPPLVVESQPKEATCPIVHQLSEGLTPIV
jgi:hypothetical protein